MNAHDCSDPWRPDARHGVSAGFVPAIVAAALERWQTAYQQAAAMPDGTDLDRAVRADRLAILADRRARWWGVLARWVYSPAGSPTPTVFGEAAAGSEYDERDNARFWRDIAADWRARAGHRPTSDAAGALSNWDELGVTA